MHGMASLIQCFCHAACNRMSLGSIVIHALLPGCAGLAHPCLYDGIQRWRTSQCADVNQRITETWCTGSILCLPCKWMQLCWPSPSYREWPRRSARCWCRSSLCARIYSLCALKFHGCQVVNTSYSSVQAKAAEAHPDGSMASELNAVNENLHIVAAFGRVFIVCREWPCTGTIHCQTACTYCNSINAGRML